MSSPVESAHQLHKARPISLVAPRLEEPNLHAVYLARAILMVIKEDIFHYHCVDIQGAVAFQTGIVFTHPLTQANNGFHTGGGGSSIVKIPGDMPPTRVYFFGPLV